MFYRFRQNNSGGRFYGPAVNVIIEADRPEFANIIAEDHDIYFDGCHYGRDCSCCGDRWHRVDSYHASETPEIYGKPAETYVSDYPSDHDGVPFLMIIYKDRVFTRQSDVL